MAKKRNYVKDLKEVQDLSKALDDLYSGSTDALKEMNQAQLKQLNNARKMADALSRSQGYSQESLDLAKDYTKTIQEDIDLLKEKKDVEDEITGSQEEQNKERKKGLAHFLKTNQQVKAVGKGIGQIDSATGGWGSKLINMILNPFNLLMALLGAGVAVMLKMNEQQRELNNLFGVAAHKNQQFLKDTITVRKNIAALGKGMKEIAATADQLTDGLNISAESSILLSGGILDTATAIGMSDSAVAGLSINLAKLRNMSLDQANIFQKQVYFLSQQNKVAPKAVLKDLAENSQTMAKWTRSSLDNLAASALAAKKLNSNLGTFDAIAENILSFEESINAEMRLRTLLGTDIDLSRARQLAASRDMLGFQKEIVKQISKAGDLNELDYFQMKGITELFGAEFEQILAINQAQQAGNDISKIGAENMKETLESAKELKGVDNVTPADQLMNTMANLDVFMQEEMMGTFTDLQDNIKKINTKIESFVGFLNMAYNIILMMSAAWVGMKIFKGSKALLKSAKALKGVKGSKSVVSAAKGQAKKGAGKALTKTATKSAGKSLLKKIPGVGLLAGLAFGAGRLMSGDWKGALGEVASGAASTIPGVGTAVSAAIDVGLAARDVNNATQETQANVEAIEQETGEQLDNIQSSEVSTRMAERQALKLKNVTLAEDTIQKIIDGFGTQLNASMDREQSRIVVTRDHIQKLNSTPGPHA
tara:strand:- start:6383 stop:8506 length:2124 start_codon:yes stop_codon:yes gene_type:complete